MSLITLARAADASRRWAVWKPWAVVGAGIAIAVAGGGFHLLAAKNFDDYDQQFSALECAKGDGCNGMDMESSGLNELLDSARQRQRIAVGAYVAAGSVLATGVMLLYLNRSRLTEQRPDSFSSSRSVAVTPVISGDLFGVLVNVTH